MRRASITRAMSFRVIVIGFIFLSLFFAIVCFSARQSVAAGIDKQSDSKYSYQSKTYIKLIDEAGKGSLTSFCMSPDGKLYGLVAPKVEYGPNVQKEKDPPREVVVADQEGKVLKRWALDFVPERVTVDNQHVYIGGHGKIAKYTVDGELVKQVDAPHMTLLLGDKEELKAGAEDYNNDMIENYKSQIENYRTILATQRKNHNKFIEDVKKLDTELRASQAKADDETKKSNADNESQKTKGDKLIKRIILASEFKKEKMISLDKTQIDDAKYMLIRDKKDGAKYLTTSIVDGESVELETNDEGGVVIDDMDSYYARMPAKSIEAMLKRMEKQIETVKAKTPEQSMKEYETLIRSRNSINSITVGKDAVYYVGASGRGYGFAVWQINNELEEPKRVVNGLSGCCGQCDVHCHGDEFFVADNGKKRVAVYSMKGKLLRHFGKEGRDGDGENFGGCCNPMNLCFTFAGQILTAESEGFVKCFNSDGKFEKSLAKSTLTGGCKHVPVATSKDDKFVFFLDQPGSRIIRLEKALVAQAEVKTSESKSEAQE